MTDAASNPLEQIAVREAAPTRWLHAQSRSRLTPDDARDAVVGGDRRRPGVRRPAPPHHAASPTQLSAGAA
jgi:hypothetical protein